MTTRRSLLSVLGVLALPGTSQAAKPAVQTPPPAEARLVIGINKNKQKMVVKLDDEKLYKWPVSTGAPGYDTPSGEFRPFRMEKEHYSAEWDDAPMPYSIFFTSDGHAIHGSYHIKSLGRRASHGCVRLHPDNAKALFALVRKTGLSNTRVIIKGGLLTDGADTGGEPRKSGFLGLFD